MKVLVRYYKDKNGVPRGCFVATPIYHHEVESVYRAITGWSFCCKRDMKKGMYSKRAGRAYACERMLFPKATHNEVPREMARPYLKFIDDSYWYFVTLPKEVKEDAKSS